MRTAVQNAGLLVVVTAVTSACGNFSQEDLLFRAAVPSKHAVALTPPGAESDAVDPSSTEQGLDLCAGNPDQLRCHAQNLAVGLNGLSAGLLDVVDAIVKHDPTRRSLGKRVWGPFFLDDQGFTARFEMTRDDSGAVFGYCLHVKGGRALPGADDDVDCDVEVSERGFVRILSGSFIPGVEDDHLAKSGTGTILFDVHNLPDNGDGFLEAIDSIEITYDNTAGKQAVDMLIVPEDASVDAATHSFLRRADGSGTFAFTAEANIGDSASPALEHMDIRAAWLADHSGRAEASITDGDVPTGETYHVEECWDAELTNVYRQQTYAVQTEETGDPALCTITTPLFD
jgi:hypothetical protein